MSPKPLQDSYWSVHCLTGVLLVLLHRQQKALGPGLTRGVSWPIQLQTLAWLWGTRGRFRRPQRQPSVQERPGPRALTQLSVEQNKTWKTPSGQMRRRVTILDHSPRAVVLKAELGQKQDPWMTCGSNGICLECLPYSAAWPAPSLDQKMQQRLECPRVRCSPTQGQVLPWAASSLPLHVFMMQ